MSRVAVYERRGKLIIHADGKTTTGVFIGIEPFVVLEKASTSALEIGAVIRDVLSRPLQLLRHPQPDEWDAVATPLYDAAGVKNWGTFVRGAELVEVETDGASIRVLPQENRGAREGFQPVAIPPIELSQAATDEEIGSAILRALALMRTSRD